jgi:hypothetical protein
MGTLVGNATIDATVDHDSLDLARQFNPQTPTHTNIVTCARNLAGDDGTKIIVGHGDAGILGTGGGDMLENANVFIGLTNPTFWSGPLGAIPNCTSLCFYACHVGATDQGAELLYKVAKVVDAEVSAPTGILSVDPTTGAFTLEAGAVWQTATPTHKPDPINPPRPSLVGPSTSEINLETDSNHEVTPFAAVTAVDVRVRYGPIQLLLRPKVRDFSANLSGQDALTFLRFIALDRPFTPPGIPLGLTTAEFVVTFDGGKKRKFAILNNRFVCDTAHPKMYYYCRPGLDDVLR